MTILLSGAFPSKRHDNTPWKKTDSSRKGKTGPLGFTGLLMQLRGDWAFFRETFAFPSWASCRICWRHRACQPQKGDCSYENFSAQAPWRKARIAPAQFFAEQAAQGISCSPIFLCPGFKLGWVCIDVLHCCDLGVSQKIVGNIFWEAQARICEGSTIKARVDNLQGKLKNYYKYAQPTSKLDNLTPDMIKAPGKGPKLRSKAAECKNSVPFAFQLSVQMAEQDPSEHCKTMLRMMSALLSYYQMVDSSEFPQEEVAKACRETCILFKALRDEARKDSGEDTKLWKLSPKFHMWIESSEFQSAELGSPRHYWCYRDEDFVGWASQLANSRGGANTCAHSALRLIQKYRAWVASH